MLSYILKIFKYTLKSFRFIYLKFYYKIFRNFVGNISFPECKDVSILPIKRKNIFKTKLSKWNVNGKLSYNYDPHSNYYIHSKLPFFLTRYNLVNFDIKFIWEISRFQHLNTSIDNEKEIFNEIRHFIKHNPVGFGPNWISSMEVGIRLVNMSFLYISIRKRNSVIENFLKESFLFIYKNLENHKKFKGNHYMSNLCSLICFGSFVEVNKYNSKILKFALTDLLKEIEVQFNEDGSYYENSTYYHFFVTEMILQTLIVLSNNKSEKLKRLLKNTFGFNTVSEIPVIKEALNKAIKFSNSISLNGLFPFIGDLDSGRFIFQNNKFDLNQLFYKIYNEKIVDSNSNIEISQSNCIVNHVSFEHKYNYNTFSYKYFKNFGLFVVKNDKLLFTIRTNYCNKKLVHAHEDIGSVYLIDSNQILLCDPGVKNYNRSLYDRNKFRFAESHNNQISNLNSFDLPKFEFKIIGDYIFNFEVNKIGIKINLVSKVDNKTYTREVQINNTSIQIVDRPYFNNLKLPNEYFNEYN